LVEYAPLKPKKRDNKDDMSDAIFMARKKRAKRGGGDDDDDDEDEDDAKEYEPTVSFWVLY
jgi:hypothetical protein